MYYAVDWMDRIDFATLRKFRPENLQRKMKEHGLLGHSIGTSGLTDPIIGEMAATEEKVFELHPGMIFSLEPTIIMPGVPGGGGGRIENNILGNPLAL